MLIDVFARAVIEQHSSPEIKWAQRDRVTRFSIIFVRSDLAPVIFATNFSDCRSLFLRVD